MAWRPGWPMRKIRGALGSAGSAGGTKGPASAAPQEVAVHAVASPDVAPSPPRETSLLSEDDLRVEQLRNRLRFHLEEERDARSSQAPAILRTCMVLATVGILGFTSFPFMLSALEPVMRTANPEVAKNTLTGIFMVPLGIVFGTMTSMTANVQRARQLNVRDIMYKEIAALDCLSHVLAKLFQRDPRRLLIAQEAVFRYIELFRDQIEPGDATSADRQRTFYAQRAAIGSVHGQLASISDRELALAAFNFSPGQSSTDLSRAWDLANRIQELQASRSANLEHSFPVAHYALMVALGMCLPFAYLLFVLWSDPVALADMDAIGLRVLYGAMCAILAAVFNFLLDMQEIFQGIYAIQPRRLRVVQAGIVNYIARASRKDVISLGEYINGYSTLWTDPGKENPVP